MDSPASIRVVHVNHEDFDVYIGRSFLGLPGSKWANPFHIGLDGTREEVISKYRAYLLGRPDLLRALPELKGKTLGCWCKPQDCHGDVLKELVEALPDEKGTRNMRKF